MVAIPREPDNPLTAYPPERISTTHTEAKIDRLSDNKQEQK